MLIKKPRATSSSFGSGNDTLKLVDGTEAQREIDCYEDREQRPNDFQCVDVARIGGKKRFKVTPASGVRLEGI